MGNLTNAQSGADISGIYNLGSSSPEGGNHLVVLENGDYAILHFGGMQLGKWKNTEKNVYQFSPNIQGSKFDLYGRHNKALEGKTKIFFKGFENGETFIQLGKAKDEEYTMQRVFNVGANCFSYHYEHTFETVSNSISFASIQYDDPKSAIITIQNPEGYNDFVAHYVEVNRYEAEPFYATFKNNGLQMEEGGHSDRSPLEEAGDDVKHLKKIIERNSNMDTIYLNPSYNVFGQIDDEEPRDIHEFHVYNEQKNAFIDTEFYVEGEENNLSDDSFDVMSIIYEYRLLKENTSDEASYKIIEKSLFEVNCD